MTCRTNHLSQQINFNLRILNTFSIYIDKERKKKKTLWKFRRHSIQWNQWRAYLSAKYLVNLTNATKEDLFYIHNIYKSNDVQSLQFYFVSALCFVVLSFVPQTVFIYDVKFEQLWHDISWHKVYSSVSYTMDRCISIW